MNFLLKNSFLRAFLTLPENRNQTETKFQDSLSKKQQTITLPKYKKQVIKTNNRLRYIDDSGRE